MIFSKWVDGTIEAKEIKEVLGKDLVYDNENIWDDIVKEVALYIKIKGYPTEIYLIYNSDFEIYDSYKDVELKIMKSYGYTDIVGLTREEFTRLKKLLEEQ